jgi:hypothetical protein
VSLVQEVSSVQALQVCVAESHSWFVPVQSAEVAQLPETQAPATQTWFGP